MNFSARYKKKLRIDKWLKQHLRLGDIHGLEWLHSQQEKLFKISWSHKSGHSWNLAGRMDNIFLAYHNARFRDCPHHLCTSKSGQKSPSVPDYRQLKQNFRCALHGSRHIRYEPQLSQSRGSDAFRVYRFLEFDESDSDQDGEQVLLEQHPDNIDQESLQLPILHNDVNLDDLHRILATEPVTVSVPIRLEDFQLPENFSLPALDNLSDLNILMTDDSDSPSTSQSPAESTLSSPTQFGEQQAAQLDDDDWLNSMFQ